MSRSDKYRKKDYSMLEESSRLFERTKIPFERSSEEVWREVSSRLFSTRKAQEIYPGLLLAGSTRRWIALAASLTMLLLAGTFARFYQKQTFCPPGETIEMEFPDGSLAELNAETTVSLHPLWWPLSRKVRLEGEAFFNVKKGKRFKVVASPGTTEVLGTTFNIMARKDRFIITCHSGRVMVKQASSQHTVTLSPNERAALKSTGELEVRKVRVDPFTPTWKSTLMMVTSMPLRAVFDEIEQHFDIRIVTPAPLNHLYTGNFDIDQPVENIISLICRPFDLVYEQRTAAQYHIYPPPPR